jgi:hypothetical protein
MRWVDVECSPERDVCQGDIACELEEGLEWMMVEREWYGLVGVERREIE